MKRCSLVLFVMSVIVVGIIVLGCAAAPSTTASTSSAATEAKAPIKIGLCTALTGPAAFYGTSTRAGATYAINEINANGGVLGRQLQLIVRDDQGKPELTVSGAKDLCVQEGINFAISPYSSGTSTAAQPIYWRYKIPTALESAMADEVLATGCPYYFRTNDCNTVCGDATLSLVKSGNYKKVALAYVNDYFGNMMLKVLQAKVKDLGADLLAVASCEINEPDLSPQALKLTSVNPDVIVMIVYPADSSNLMRAAKALGYTGAFVGYSAFAADGARDVGGHLIDGVAFPLGRGVHGIYAWNRPGYAQWRIKFDAAIGEGIFKTVNAPREGISTGGYTAAVLIAQGIQAAGSTDPDKFMQALTGKVFNTPLCDISFPNAPKSWESQPDWKMMYIAQYVNGHMRLWPSDTRCIETFESTRCQAEEEVYKSDAQYQKGVTIKDFFKKWQTLLQANQTKIESEISAREASVGISPSMADMYRQTLKELLATNF